MTNENLPVPAPDPRVEEWTNHPAISESRKALQAAAEPLRAALLAADDAIRDAIARRDLEDLAYLLRAIRTVKDALLRPLIDDMQVLDRMAEDACAGIMDNSKMMTEVGLLHRRKSGGSTTWSGRDLLIHLARGLVDPATGERVDAIPLTVLMEVLPQASSASATWKITGLRSMGVDPDEWKFTIGDRYTVTIIEEGIA